MNGMMLVGIVFRFVNFGVLVGFIYEGCRRYLIPFFRDQFRALIIEIDQLKALRKSLVNDMTDIERGLVEDHHEIAQLKEKLACWKMRVEKENAHAAIQYEKRMEAERIRVELQAEKIKQARIFAQALPPALAAAHAQLDQKFSVSDAQEKYLYHLTSRLKGS